MSVLTVLWTWVRIQWNLYSGDTLGTKASVRWMEVGQVDHQPRHRPNLNLTGLPGREINIWICVRQIHTKDGLRWIVVGIRCTKPRGSAVDQHRSKAATWLVRFATKRIFPYRSVASQSNKGTDDTFLKRFYDWSVLLRFVSRLLHSRRSFPSVAVVVRKSQKKRWFKQRRNLRRKIKYQISLLAESLFSLVYWAGAKRGLWYSRKFYNWFFVVSFCVV